MKGKRPLEKIMTGVRNFDEILQGGIPKRSLIVFAGPPGSGKTILSQQLGFFNANAEKPVIFFQTLGEPTAKSLSFTSQFNFFDAEKVGQCVHFIDLGDIIRAEGVKQGLKLLLEHIRRIKPALVVIDSFKAFDDLARSSEELRKFSYEVAVELMAWECTTFLLGEFSKNEMDSSPLFSIVDGIVIMSQRQESCEQQRFIQVFKMRGTAHSRDEHSLMISDNGIDLFAPRVTIKRIPPTAKVGAPQGRVKTGNKSLDLLLKEGIPPGFSCLISGVSGTGKSLLCLEFLYRGAAEYNEKGLLFLFEENTERILEVAAQMGWDLKLQIERKMIEIISIPRPNILVEMHLLMIHNKINQFQAKRVVIDSTSMLLYKLQDLRTLSEKVYQLTTMIQNAQAVGFFVSDVPFGSNQLSRFSVEETMVDGVILLGTSETPKGRDRFLEVYKLRNTHHAIGKHKMEIRPGGICIRPD